MEKKHKKAKRLSEEALQIAVKRREVKSKGEKERYNHLNVEFQTIARRDKKSYFTDQCKEIEENSRIFQERLEISSRKLKYQGNTSCNDGLNKGQKLKILRKSGKNTQKNCTKRIFMNQIIKMV